MKKIEISPEWILDKLSVTQQADGYGNITICSDSVSDSHLIKLALSTLGIKFESCCVGCDTNPDAQYSEVEWKFNIEAIKNDCPNLYTKWISGNDAHAYRLRVAQQLLDSIEVKEIRETDDAQ